MFAVFAANPDQLPVETSHVQSEVLQASGCAQKSEQLADSESRQNVLGQPFGENARDGGFSRFRDFFAENAEIPESRRMC